MAEQMAGNIEIIFPADAIDRRISALAGEIAATGLTDLLVVAILKGSFVFAADLIRALHHSGLSPEVDFITLSSYGKSTQSSGSVNILQDLDLDLAGRNVLLVDDILESGRTLAFARQLVLSRGAKSVATCVLLRKPVARAVAIEPDFHAFNCPPVFVIGYGMDAGYRYRQLPFVGCLTEPTST